MYEYRKIMSISYLSYSDFSINTPYANGTNYEAVEADGNMFHCMYFTLNVRNDTNDNQNNEDNFDIESALECLTSTPQKYDSDFIARISMMNSNDCTTTYQICLETPFLRMHDQFEADTAILTFIRFEEALYNTMANHRNDDDYDNDDDAFDDKESLSGSDKLYVDGEYISTDDFELYKMSIRDDLFNDNTIDDSQIILEHLNMKHPSTSASNENGILRAIIDWQYREQYKTMVIPVNTQKITKKIENDVFFDISQMFPS